MLDNLKLTLLFLVFLYSAYGVVAAIDEHIDAAPTHESRTTHHEP